MGRASWLLVESTEPRHDAEPVPEFHAIVFPPVHPASQLSHLGGLLTSIADKVHKLGRVSVRRS